MKDFGNVYPFGPKILRLGNYSMGIIKHLHQDICARVFITASFLIVGKLETAELS